MSFEVRERDLLARIGRIKTKSSHVETPLLLPVINPLTQPIPPTEMREEFNCRAIVTNSYIIKKHFEKEAEEKGIHDLLKFPDTIMTDSGAYQILVYGRVETTPEEIARFQERIDTDIAIILDVPTGWNTSRTKAEWTVKETLRRAKLTLQSITRKDILWVGPVQGGNHLDLVTYSAKEISKIPFHIYALGSPTQVMEQYLFDMLVDMIMTAKVHLPIDKPLHLFGAGHPFMFAFAVALGCDMFDSAAYAIYARDQRYLTDYGTAKLSQLEFTPCPCDVCSKHSPQDLREMLPRERERALAKHNLHVCLAEIGRIKQAIKEGRLWELLELRARSHPSLLQALKRLEKYAEFIERHSPISKERGLLYFGSTGLSRPEILRHRKRLLQNYTPPKDSEILVLLPQMTTKPFHKSKEYERAWRRICKTAGDETMRVHVCIYAAPFGVIPTEIDEVYPLSQFETALPPDEETIEYVAKQVENYILTNKYRSVILHHDPSSWKNKVANACRKACKKTNTKFTLTSKDSSLWNNKALDELAKTISIALGRGRDQ